MKRGFAPLVDLSIDQFSMAAIRLALVVLMSIFSQGLAELTVNVNPSEVLMAKGSPVYIDCSASGSASPAKITWSLDGIVVANTEERKVFPNNTLYIKSLSKSYRGSYVCEAKVDSIQSKTAVVRVEIAILRKIPEMADRVEFSNKDVTITCPKSRRESIPTPTVRWEANGKALTMDPRFKINGRSLTILRLKKEDSRNYTCIVANIAGVRQQTMNLQVYVPSSNKVTPKSLVVLEKKEAVFKCVSNADPPFPSKLFTWIKDNKETVKGTENIVISPVDGTLKFKSVQASDNGTYSCSISMVSSSNDRMDFKDDCSLKVLRYLKFEAVNFRKFQSLDRKSKKSHLVSCAFVGDGLISVTWKKKGVATLPSRMKPMGSSLMINDLQLSDKGLYQCTVVGKHNVIDATIAVNVFEGAEFTKKPTNITVKEGESGRTSCEGTGIPLPKVTWAKAETNSALPKNFKVVKNTTLVVNDAEMSNAGPYFCMIANGPTSRNVEFEVIVTRNDQKKPQKGQQSMGRTVGIAVGCAGAYIVLVIGLMIYCRSRRSRMLKRQGNITTEIEDGEFNKDLLDNGDEEYPMNGDLKHLDQWHFPREDLNEERTLGHGKYGKVYTAKARGIHDGEIELLVAVKQLPKGNEASRKAYDQELEMLTQLQHENVIKLLGVCVKDFPLLMITEYSEQGDLKNYLTSANASIGLSTKLSLCLQIAKAMEYLSANGIIHHDLACRNCVVMSDECQIKVAFFSISEDLYAEDYCLYNDAHVPLRWLSPEALFSEDYSEKSGVWAYAVVMWEIFSNCKQPYTGKTDEEVVKCLKKKIQLDACEDLPSGLLKLMKNCLRVNPSERPKFTEIVTEVDSIPSDSSV